MDFQLQFNRYLDQNDLKNAKKVINNTDSILFLLKRQYNIKSTTQQLQSQLKENIHTIETTRPEVLSLIENTEFAEYEHVNNLCTYFQKKITLKDNSFFVFTLNTLKESNNFHLFYHQNNENIDLVKCNSFEEFEDSFNENAYFLDTILGQYTFVTFDHIKQICMYMYEYKHLL